MKEFWKAGTALLLTAAICFTAGGFNAKPVLASEERIINVSGKGVIKAMPDEATINLGLETSANTAVEAQQKNADQMVGILKKLEELGINKEDIKTSRFQVYPDYDYSNNKRVLNGYTATNMIDVRTKEVDNVSAIIDAATAAGVNVNNGVTFSVSDTNQFYQEALKLALDNANVSAKTLAGSMGVQIGTPSKVEEFSNDNSYVVSRANVENMKMADQSTGGASTNISYDAIEIIARLTVSYEY